MKNIDWESILSLFIAGIIIVMGFVAGFAIIIAALIIDNFKWILMCATALLMASWFL